MTEVLLKSAVQHKFHFMLADFFMMHMMSTITSGLNKKILLVTIFTTLFLDVSKNYKKCYEIKNFTNRN